MAKNIKDIAKEAFKHAMEYKTIPNETFETALDKMSNRFADKFKESEDAIVDLVIERLQAKHDLSVSVGTKGAFGISGNITISKK